MARPRKPTSVLELTGSFKAHPERAAARKSEPVPSGEIGDAPSYFDDESRKCWTEIVGMCHVGTLCAADRLIVEHGARVLAALRASPVYADAKLMIRLEATLGKLGLTPADRSKVQVIKPKGNTNPFLRNGAGRR
ncbi:hypothetical protein Bpro_2971 [Polaromonas sp. JS666]|nr:hypothetical protein Bpro_2971 [Polaromonas sp. JS666]